MIFETSSSDQDPNFSAPKTPLLPESKAEVNKLLAGVTFKLEIPELKTGCYAVYFKPVEKIPPTTEINLPATALTPDLKTDLDDDLAGVGLTIPIGKRFTGMCYDVKIVPVPGRDGNLTKPEKNK